MVKLATLCGVCGTRIPFEIADDATATAYVTSFKAAAAAHKETFENQTHKVVRDEMDRIVEVKRHPLSIEHD